MKDIKETIEWKNSTEGVMKIENKVELPGEKGTVLGFKTETTEVKVKAEDLQKGIDVISERMLANKKKINSLNENLKNMGKIPNKTPEMVRLQKNLLAINTIGESEKIKNQLKGIEEQNTLDSTTLDSRMKLLKQRPKKFYVIRG